MTRSTWTLALFLILLLPLLSPCRALAQGLPDPHIRSSEPELLAALEQGARVSPTLRGLVDRLEASDVIVYLMFDRRASPNTAGHISILTTAGGRRYLRVSIDRHNAGCQRIAILGHELQHAIEIAESPSAVDDITLIALYRRIGFRSNGATIDSFDSAGAILTGRSVEKEAVSAMRGIGSR
jgi:hypothetical protein